MITFSGLKQSYILYNVWISCGTRIYFIRAEIYAGQASDIDHYFYGTQIRVDVEFQPYF